MKKTLTAKQEAFCQAYMRTKNADEAYRRAYNVSAKTTAKSVRYFAESKMENPKIVARLEELEKEQSSLILAADDKPLEDAAPGSTPLWELICRPFKIIARKFHFQSGSGEGS
jgi:hypothetical protein